MSTFLRFIQYFWIGIARGGFFLFGITGQIFNMSAVAQDQGSVPVAPTLSQMGWRDHFWLLQHHKLKVKHPTSCGAVWLESADYQLILDWCRLVQLQQISDRSLAVIIIYRNKIYLHFYIFSYRISHIINKRYLLYLLTFKLLLRCHQRSTYIHGAAPSMYSSDFAPNSVPLGVQFELPKWPQKPAEVVRWKPLEQAPGVFHLPGTHACVTVVKASLEPKGTSGNSWAQRF